MCPCKLNLLGHIPIVPWNPPLPHPNLKIWLSLSCWGQVSLIFCLKLMIKGHWPVHSLSLFFHWSGPSPFYPFLFCLTDTFHYLTVNRPLEAWHTPCLGKRETHSGRTMRACLPPPSPQNKTYQKSLDFALRPLRLCDPRKCDVTQDITITRVNTIIRIHALTRVNTIT